MMSAKHTPGPWRLVEMGSYSVTCDADAYDMVGVGLNDGYPLAITVSRNPIMGRAESNAHLIAAAPDLLAALRQMVVNSENDGHSYRDCHRSALEAIAKAEGRS